MATDPKSIAAKKGVATRVRNKRVADSTAVREAHVAAAPERYTSLQDHFKTSMNNRQIYSAMGYGSNDEKDSNVGQGELFPHPARVEDPKRWEDLHPDVQNRIRRRAEEFGVTEESATKALGAQVDTAFRTEGTHKNFYTARGNDANGDMLPKERILTSAKENKVEPTLQAVANAITSPKQSFARTAKTGVHAGKRIYPNDMLATSAVEHGKAGTPEEARTPEGVGGFHGKVRQAAHVVDDVVNQGKTVGESWHPGSKTGPYANAWVDPNGTEQFFTSDTHSGGGGIAPHLSKDDQEKYLTIGGIHAFNDHVARRVAHDRGIRSLTGMQSAQWSQERRDRGLQAPHDDGKRTPEVDPHQGHLF